jgi:hypothetical protein
LLKILSDRRSRLNDEMSEKLRAVEVKYELEKAPLYEKRAKLISGEIPVEEEEVAKFGAQ